VIAIERPETLDQALGIVAASRGGKAETMLLAGGTDIMPRLQHDPHIDSMKHGNPLLPGPVTPLILVSLSRIAGLDGIVDKDGELRIGSRCTLTRLAGDPLVKKSAPMLAEAASQMASPQIRNRGTVGGNIMNASPAADTVSPLLALEASVILRSSRGERRIPLADLLKGPGQTTASHGEILTEATLPLSPARPLQFFRRLGARHSLACAKVSAAFCAALESGHLKSARIALGAVGPTVIVADKTAALIEGRRLTGKLAEEAAAMIRSEICPIDDVRSTKEYRTIMAGELVREGLNSLMNQQ